MIPFEDFGGYGRTLHFAHANGYPPGSYKTFLNEMAGNFHVIAMHLRPLWPGAKPQGIKDWKPFSVDLLEFLNQQALNNIIAVGHSMGGTATLRLALNFPDYFQTLILIDPVIFPPLRTMFWNFVSWIGLSNYTHPLVKSAYRRRRVFSSKKEMYDNYRKKHVFIGMGDQELHHYVEALAKPHSEGTITLSYSPEWEARVYLTGIRADLDIWRSLHTLKVPLIIIKGQESNTFLERTAKLMERKLPSITLEEIEGATHLVPLEKPFETAERILHFLKLME